MSKASARFVKALAMGLIPPAITAGGWFLGGGNAESFAAEPVRVCFVLFSMAAFVITPYFTPRVENLSSKGKRHDRRQDWMIPVASLTSLALVLVSTWSDARGYGPLPGGAVLRWGGMALYAVGFWLMIWAPVYLGRQFSIHVTIQEDHQLITSGPFAVLRHPRYAGCVYWGFGLALVFASAPGLLVAAIYLALFIWRLTDEERLLAAHFQEQWRDYAHATKRLVPFVY